MLARRAHRVWALSAAAWCGAFGALSLSWAAGGTLGVDQLAVSLQERADERETGFVALVAATGIAKLVGARVPLWLAFGPPSPAGRKLLLFLCWAGGALLAVYGLTDVASLHSMRARADGAPRQRSVADSVLALLSRAASLPLGGGRRRRRANLGAGDAARPVSGPTLARMLVEGDEGSRGTEGD
jgi:hypothetical protein